MLGNPFVLSEAFSRLDHALSEVIDKVQAEKRAAGSSSNEDALVRKFAGWRDELTQIRGGERVNVRDGTLGEKVSSDSQAETRRQQEGGLFTD